MTTTTRSTRGTSDTTTREPRRRWSVRAKGLGWEVRWKDAQGLPHSKTIRGTREDADLFGAQQTVDAVRGRSRIAKRITLRAYGPGWLEGQADRLRPRSIKRYGALLDHWLSHPMADVPMEDLDLADIRGALARMAAGRRGHQALGAASRAAALAVLRLILDEALEDGYVTRNLARVAKAPKATGSKVAQVPMGAELARLRAAIDADDYQALWLLGLLGGLRIGEALGLTWGDVDLEGYRIHVRRTVEDGGDRTGPPKSANGYREVIMHPDLRDALVAWRAGSVGLGMRAHPSALVFDRGDGTHYRAETQRERFGHLCDRAKVRRFRYHDLRHTAATALATGGTDARRIMAQLGHASLGMTTRYTHLAPDAAALSWGDLSKVEGPRGA